MSNIKITKAILQVMQKVEGIDKSMTVGSGRNSYKGVSDKDVRVKIGLAMRECGLCIVPIDISPKYDVERWEETNDYGTKTKQSVFTEVVTKYLLLHESGESLEIAGYGHGVDSQDKGAGKATTYALKNALLATFLVPTGVEDTDNTHSDDLPVPQRSVPMITKVQIDKIAKLIKSKGRTESEMLKKAKIEKLTDLTKQRADGAIKYLESLPEATLQ